MLGPETRLRAGDLEAVFLPRAGMLCASLRHRGEQLLGRVADLAAAAVKGSTGGIPLLHPWANRLAAPSYEAAGQAVVLDPGSPLLHPDGNGLPIHGVPWAKLAWELEDEGREALAASLDWSSGPLLAVFPFPHRLELEARLDPGGLTVTTSLVATARAPVPVSFGFHPYLTLPGVSRARFQVELPPMFRLGLDELGIPTGAREPFAGLGGPLDRDYDDGFACLPERPVFALAGGGRRIDVAFLEGYPYAQVFAPPGQDFVCFEPMTAPTNALRSGEALRLVAPGKVFRAAFRISVGAA